MDQSNAKMLSQLFDELSTSYSRISTMLKAFSEGQNVDLKDVFPQIQDAANAAGATKGKKQKKLPRYETTWSTEELTKLEEGLKKFGFDVAKVQSHIGSRKAADVKKYMTMFAKAGAVPGVSVPEEHADEDDESSEEEESVAPVKPSAKKGASLPSVKKSAASSKAAPKKKESSSSSSDDSSDVEDEKPAGKRGVVDSESSEDEPPKKNAPKHNKNKKQKKQDSDSD